MTLRHKKEVYIGISTSDVEHVLQTAHAARVDVAEVVVGEQHAAEVGGGRAVQPRRHGGRQRLRGAQSPRARRALLAGRRLRRLRSLPLDALLAGHQLRRRG